MRKKGLTTFISGTKCNIYPIALELGQGVAETAAQGNSGLIQASPKLCIPAMSRAAWEALPEVVRYFSPITARPCPRAEVLASKMNLGVKLLRGAA